MRDIIGTFATETGSIIEMTQKESMVKFIKRSAILFDKLLINDFEMTKSSIFHSEANKINYFSGLCYDFSVEAQKGYKNLFLCLGDISNNPLTLYEEIDDTAQHLYQTVNYKKMVQEFIKESGIEYSKAYGTVWARIEGGVHSKGVINENNHDKIEKMFKHQYSCVFSDLAMPKVLDTHGIFCSGLFNISHKWVLEQIYKKREATFGDFLDEIEGYTLWILEISHGKKFSN